MSKVRNLSPDEVGMTLAALQLYIASLKRSVNSASAEPLKRYYTDMLYQVTAFHADLASWKVE